MSIRGCDLFFIVNRFRIPILINQTQENSYENKNDENYFIPFSSVLFSFRRMW